MSFPSSEKFLEFRNITVHLNVRIIGNIHLNIGTNVKNIGSVHWIIENVQPNVVSIGNVCLNDQHIKCKTKCWKYWQ